MNRFLINILSVAALLLPVVCSAKSDMQQKLEEYISGKDARIGVAVIIEGKDTVEVNGSKDFPLMSVMKFPQALSVAEWLDRQGKSLSDSIHIGPEALREDTYSPMLQKYGKRALRLSYGELLDWSLTESDNNACDILFSAIGGVQGCSKILREMGHDAGIVIEVDEAQMHRDPYQSYRNRATPLAMAGLMWEFDSDIRHRSDAFGSIASLLEQCRTGQNRLPYPLPENAVCAHKTGTGFDLPDGRLMAVNDCAYIHIPDGPNYAIAVFIADSGYDMASTEGIIATISQIVLTSLIDND